MPEPAAPPSDIRTESTPPTADARPFNDANSAAQSKASTGIAASLISTPVAIFPVAALGLVVTGFLLRVVMKISAARRQRITIDRHDFDWGDDRREHELREDQVAHEQDALGEYLQRSIIPAAADFSPRRPSRVGDRRPEIAGASDSASWIANKISMPEHRRIEVDPHESDWIDDRRQHGCNDDQRCRQAVSIDPRERGWIDDRPHHEGRNNQQQHKSVDEANELLDDLQSSLIAAVSECPRPSPLQADDGWSKHDGRGKGGASPISDEIAEHQEVLDRLRRDLDRLLQSPKVA
jgi:hypothetical protein